MSALVLPSIFRKTLFVVTLMMYRFEHPISTLTCISSQVSKVTYVIFLLSYSRVLQSVFQHLVLMSCSFDPLLFSIFVVYYFVFLLFDCFLFLSNKGLSKILRWYIGTIVFRLFPVFFPFSIRFERLFVSTLLGFVL